VVCKFLSSALLFFLPTFPTLSPIKSRKVEVRRGQEIYELESSRGEWNAGSRDDIH